MSRQFKLAKISQGLAEANDWFFQDHDGEYVIAWSAKDGLYESEYEMRWSTAGHDYTGLPVDPRNPVVHFPV